VNMNIVTDYDKNEKTCTINDNAEYIFDFSVLEHTEIDETDLNADYFTHYRHPVKLLFTGHGVCYEFPIGNLNHFCRLLKGDGFYPNHTAADIAKSITAALTYVVHTPRVEEEDI